MTRQAVGLPRRAFGAALLVGLALVTVSSPMAFRRQGLESDLSSYSQTAASSAAVRCAAKGSREAPREAHLLSAFGFDAIDGGRTADGSGRGVAAAVIDAQLTSGRFHNAVELNGVSAYVRVDDPGWPTRDYTFAIWVFPRSVKGWHSILEIQTRESRGVEMTIAPGGYVEVWSAGRLRLRNGIPLRAMTWTHLAITRNGSLISLLQNGLPERAGKDATSFDFDACPGLIGVDADAGCAGNLNGYFSGAVDDVQVYDCALSADGVRTIMADPSNRRSGSTKET